MFDLHFFTGEDDQWYWHVKADNEKIVCDGSEGYENKEDAERIAGIILDLNFVRWPPTNV